MNCERAKANSSVAVGFVAAELISSVVIRATPYTPDTESATPLQDYFTSTSSIPTYIATLSRIGAIVQNIQAFRNMHGDNYKSAAKGLPGSFSVRHPILSFFLPFVTEVSVVRGYLHIKDECVTSSQQLSGDKCDSLSGCRPRRLKRRKENWR